MRKEDVLRHFDDSSLEVGKAIGISRQAVDQWGEIIPEGAAYKLQVITGGRLQVDPNLYRKDKK